MLRRFGYYTTESNGHLSEYVPWYRKRPREIRKWIDLSSWINGETGGYLRVCTEGRNWFETDFPNWLKEPTLAVRRRRRAATSTASYIIEALETGRVYRGHFNVVNNGCITNLPDDCHRRSARLRRPQRHQHSAWSATCRWAARPSATPASACSAWPSRRPCTATTSCCKQAMMMDPLIGAVCNPPEIWQMVDEMLVAQARWLPQYKRAVAAAQTPPGKSGTLIKTKKTRAPPALKTQDGRRDERKQRARRPARTPRPRPTRPPQTAIAQAARKSANAKRQQGAERRRTIA